MLFYQILRTPEIRHPSASGDLPNIIMNSRRQVLRTFAGMAPEFYGVPKTRFASIYFNKSIGAVCTASSALARM